MLLYLFYYNLKKDMYTTTPRPYGMVRPNGPCLLQITHWTCILRTSLEVLTYFHGWLCTIFTLDHLIPSSFDMKMLSLAWSPEKWVSGRRIPAISTWRIRRVSRTSSRHITITTPKLLKNFGMSRRKMASAKIISDLQILLYCCSW